MEFSQFHQRRRLQSHRSARLSGCAKSPEGHEDRALRQGHRLDAVTQILVASHSGFPTARRVFVASLWSIRGDARRTHRVGRLANSSQPCKHFVSGRLPLGVPGVGAPAQTHATSLSILDSIHPCCCAADHNSDRDFCCSQRSIRLGRPASWAFEPRCVDQLSNFRPASARV